ncbi:B-box zinc finger [Popillia japonica]|uniref:B-box zinc finger n=1 Tax=Popillia japonica TaxID=7064 RepID=A0AAW1NK34_POPJA
METTIKQEYSELKDIALGKEDFSDMNGTMFGDGAKMNSNSPLEDGLLGDPESCGMCGEKLMVPRVLSCLHVFCEHCLDKKMIGEGGDAGTAETTITCPTCNQDTKVGTKKLASLPLDVMTTNISDVSNSVNLQCTSCTAKEVAISRCCTCHNLLCGNCETAHRYMRCFSSHKVISLDELRKDGQKITIHKPLICELHAGEIVIYYCSTCNVPACAECAKTEHKVASGHQCESISDSEIRVRQELETMLAESKSKIEQMVKASGDLDNSLEELANQRSTAKDLINESYQSYKAVLEKCRDTALEELNKLYRERELKVMDMTEKVGKDISMLEDACKFASRLLENGTVAEIMYLRNIVGTQLLNLINNTLKPEKKYFIEFHTEFNEFESSIRNLYGKFQTESTVVKPKTTSSPLTVSVNLPPLSINGANMTNGCAGSSLSNSSPISLPTSMQSSFDGDLGANLPNLAITQSPPVSQINSALQGFTSIAEYNIAQLASLAENNASAATSPTPPFSLAELFTTDTAYKNLQSLAKLGLNSTESTLTNGGGMLVRPNSPAATLNITNTLLNGFNAVSSSTSPLLSTPDDIIPDPLNSIVPPPTGQVIQRSNKVSPMQIRCKFGQLGPNKGHFNSPHGFCLGTEEDIVVADTNNHRIQVFEKTGTFKFQFGIAGKDEGQLWYPRKVAVMRANGKYVVCDRGNERSRMQIFTKNGHFLKKIAIRYIDIVAGLAVTSHGEIVAVDSVSPTVFVISENGDLLRWFDCSDFMREPSDIAIHGKEFYVCDFKGHNVVVFNEDGNFLRRIGWENVTSYPNGIDISDAGDVLIGDSHGNRFHVAVFSRDGPLISEFECPYVKVSRCCGLKITSEGYVKTPSIFISN